MCGLVSEEQRREWARQRKEDHLRWRAEEEKRELDDLRSELDRHRRLLAYVAGAAAAGRPPHGVAIDLV